MILIFLQLLLLGALSLGWMFWLNQWTTDGAWRWKRSVVLFGTGFAVQVLLLQNLIYLDIPVKHAFAIPAIIGAIGLWRLIGSWRDPSQVDISFRINIRYGAALFMAVFTLQSASGMLQGPANYFGKGRIDHLNYTLIAEFLKSDPFSTPEAEMNQQPWLVKALQYKNLRIGQSVSQAYLASLSFVTAKAAYAALSSFFVAMLALAAFVLAQSFSLGRPYCILASLWVGLAPSTTRIHLDGSLSQMSVLFVFPLLIIWARLAGESIRFRLTTGAVLVSYLLVSYTELFVIGLFLLALLSVGLAILWSPRQLKISAQVTVVGLLLVPAYLPRAYRFTVGQYTVAAAVHHNLEMLAEDGGTVYGWAKALIEIPIAPSPPERQAVISAGVVLLALCFIGLFARSRRSQLFLAAAVLTPVVFLVILLSSQVLSKYPFMKICDSFAFLWVLLAMRGISLIAVLARRQGGSLAPALLHVVPGGFFLLAFLGFFVQHRLIATQSGSLSLLNKKEFQDSLEYINAHPERTYVIVQPDGLAAGWIAYESRFSKVYVLSRWISDVSLVPGSLAFTVLPTAFDGGSVTSIGPDGPRDVTKDGGAVDLEIYNPQGQDGGDSALWYWLGDTMELEFFSWVGEKPREFPLTFHAEPGPANPSPTRTVRLTNLRTLQQDTLRFAGPATLTVPLVLVRGKNRFRLDSVEPLEHVNRFPNDPRKHMSRLVNFKLGPPKTINDGDPRLSPFTSKDSVPLPVLSLHNPQNEDRSGDQSWYWVGKQMEIEVVRTDQSSKNFDYEVSFEAQAGPANPDPKRKLRVRNLSDGRATDFAITVNGELTVPFTAKPGSTRLLIEVLSPAEQTVHIPNDPRNHMVRAANFRIKPARTVVAPARPAKLAPKPIPVPVSR